MKGDDGLCILLLTSCWTLLAKQAYVLHIPSPRNQIAAVLSLLSSVVDVSLDAVPILRRGLPVVDAAYFELVLHCGGAVGWWCVANASDTMFFRQCCMYALGLQ